MQPDEIIELRLTALQVEQIMQNLLEMPYRVAAPMLQSLNAQVAAHRMKMTLLNTDEPVNGC